MFAQHGFDLVEAANGFEDRAAGFEAFIVGGLELAPEVGDAGGAADFPAAAAPELAVVFVAVALEDDFEVGAGPIGGMMMLAAGLPAEDEIAAEAAVACGQRGWRAGR